MWHEKQENITLRGQTTCPPKKLNAENIENKILPPPSGNFDIDFLGGSLRKRKSTAVDPPGTTSEYCFPWESKPQQFSSRLGINGRGNTQGLCLNQTKPLEPLTVGHQLENDQFYYQNDFSGTWPTSNENFHRTGIEKISNLSFSVPPQSLGYEGSFPLNKMLVGEDLTVPSRQPQACNMLGQTEAHGRLPFMKSLNAHTEKAKFGPAFQDLARFGIKNHVVTDIMPLEMCNTSSEHLRPVEMLQQSFLQPNKFSGGLDGSTCSQEAKKFKISGELKQSGHYSNNSRPTVETASLGALLCTEPNETNRSLQNNLQFGSAPVDICLGDPSETKGRGHGGDDIKMKENTEASDMENLKYSLTEEFLSENSSSPANIVVHGRKNDPSHGSLKLGEKSKLPSGKVASTVAEKLWDGSLQLNSSVTMSAVAYFKSGEKLLDINWPEFVEVKGKVRLEAFEKYIQDLPRSRNRGLMVISLCWKEGSSETGLTGTKEVAKGYRKGERVGYAQLSQGIDLYICPRSDTIITILAKYGFFKGMAVVEDNPDSLIGCVVWRRNRTSTSSVAKKLDSKNNSFSEQPLDSPSDSSTQQVAEKNVSPTPPAQESNPHTSVTSSSLGSVDKNGTGSKNIDSSEVQVEVGNSSSGANSLATPLLSNSSSIPVGQQTSPYSYSPSLQGSHGLSLEVEASHTCCSGAEQPKASLELQKSVIPLPSDVMKQTMPTDDDDLPEFDFRTACGISLTAISKPLDAAPLDKKLPAEEIRDIDGSVLPAIPIVQQAISSSNQRSDNSSAPMLPSAANQGMPPLKKVCERESQIPVFHKLEEKNSVQSKATLTPVGTTAFGLPKNPFDEIPRKNLFDDDDDMPEWCPPELHKQLLAETTRPSTTRPYELPSFTFQILPPCPLPPLLPLPSPSSPATRPAFSSQAFPPAFPCPITITARAPQPIPFHRGPSYSMGFNSSPVLRPQFSSFDVKPPFRPAHKRDWRL